MDALRSFRDHIVKAFKFPNPYNWGYPVFYGALGFIVIIQSEVSQKEKHPYSILTHIYGI